MLFYISKAHLGVFPVYETCCQVESVDLGAPRGPYYRGREAYATHADVAQW